MTVHSPLLNRSQTSHWKGAILVPNSRLARGNGLSPVGCVKAMWRYATRRASKQKRRLLRFPGYYQYSNEIVVDLLTGAGLL